MHGKSLYTPLGTPMDLALTVSKMTCRLNNTSIHQYNIKASLTVNSSGDYYQMPSPLNRAICLAVSRV